ncbi:hypothetical protein [Leptospira sp. GIMC2001]|uniref:hypothetical protein n=1 Tax=Leptospira sp. GIMC2001 TaxID=1513297 RepID=UPI003FA5F8F8
MIINFRILILGLLILFIFPIYAQEEDKRKPEVGFWLGASNPFPGSPSQSVLDTSLGFGLFTRFPWPYFLYTELGGSYSTYLSQTERALTTMPIYAALAYQLPLDLPVKFFLKAGGGSAYVVARPANTSRWNPLIYGGLEASFIAGRKVRIGIRLDYNKIMETNMDIPPENNIPLASPYDDYRLLNPAQYRLQNADFFHFGLMVSLLI